MEKLQTLDLVSLSPALLFQVPSNSSTPSEEPESGEADGARACQVLAALEPSCCTDVGQGRVCGTRFRRQGPLAAPA